MKYQKYLLILVLIVSITINMPKAYADQAKYEKNCYYIASDSSFKASLKLKSGFDHPLAHSISAYSQVYIDKNGSLIQHNGEKLNNWFGGAGSMFEAETSKGKYKFDYYYKSSTEANKDSNPACPKYLVFQDCNVYRVWGTENESLAINAVNAINQTNNCKGYYAGHTNSNGSEINSQQYYGEFANTGMGGEEVELNCDNLFGDKDDETSLRYFINRILLYVRIIVPILIILLGSLDMAKAVIAAKEDDMKKAQTQFIKRLIAGLVVFLIPVFVDIIMGLADIVWEGMGYTTCSL